MGMFGSTRAVFLDCIDVERAVEAAGINGVVGAALRAAGAIRSAMVLVPRQKTLYRCPRFIQLPRPLRNAGIVRPFLSCVDDLANKPRKDQTERRRG